MMCIEATYVAHVGPLLRPATCLAGFDTNFSILPTCDVSCGAISCRHNRLRRFEEPRFGILLCNTTYISLRLAWIVVHLGVGTDSSLALVSEEVIHGFTGLYLVYLSIPTCRTFNVQQLSYVFFLLENVPSPFSF